MNSTQKTALIFLFSVLLGTVSFAYVGLILLFRRMPPGPLGQIAAVSAALVTLLFIALTVLSITTRQSRVEPESDERDNMIKGKAITISFVCGWLLLAVVLLIRGITLGQAGSVPVYLPTVIHWGLFNMTLLIYSVMVLVPHFLNNATM